MVFGRKKKKEFEVIEPTIDMVKDSDDYFSEDDETSEEKDLKKRIEMLDKKLEEVKNIKGESKAEKPTKRWNVRQIATQTEPLLFDGDKPITWLEALAEILNRTE